MKTIFVLSCLLVVLASTSMQASTLNNVLYAKYLCRNKQAGYRALVPGSCSQYYECQNGISQLRSCPRYYDSTKRICVNSNPGCVETLKREVSAPAGCNGPCCGMADGFVLDPLNSQVYYECQANCVVSKNTCPGDQMFDLVKLVCASPIVCGSGGCVATTPSPPCSTTTTPCSTKTTSSTTTTTTPCSTKRTSSTTTTTTACSTSTTSSTTTTICSTTTTTSTTNTTTPCSTKTTSSTTTTTTQCSTKPSSSTATTTTPCSTETTSSTTTTTTPRSTKTKSSTTTTDEITTPCTTTPTNIQTPCITTTRKPCVVTTTPCAVTTKAPCASANNAAVAAIQPVNNPAHNMLLQTLQSNIDLYMRFACLDKPNGFMLASLKKCNEYYICSNGVALPVSCGDKYFNALKGICDLPENTGCTQLN